MLRPGQKIGKYKLRSRIANGPYATVFRALDTLEGIHVALKIPHKGLVTKESLDKEWALDRDSAFEWEVTIQAELMLDPNFREAYEAFTAKREAKYQ